MTRNDYELCLKLADQGSTEAAYVAGVMINLLCENHICGLAGQGILEAEELKFKCFKQAAEGGFIDGMFLLAGLYFDGTSVRKDYGLCLDWLWRASLLGNLQAKTVVEVRASIPQDITYFHNQVEEIPSHLKGISCRSPSQVTLLLQLAMITNVPPDGVFPPFVASIPTLTVSQSKKSYSLCSCPGQAILSHSSKE
jgi:TPR repeat protein